MSFDFSSTVLGPAMAIFGEPVTYIPEGLAQLAISGIYKEAYQVITIKDGAPVSTTKPALGVKLDQFPPGFAPAQGDQVLLRARRFTIADVQPDGIAGAMLLLNELT